MLPKQADRTEAPGSFAKNVIDETVGTPVAVFRGFVGTQLIQPSNKVKAMTVSTLVRTNEKTNCWLKELAEDLHWDDPDLVFKALRTVLHELRDRLPTGESAQLASQLPMLIRGCYYENWVPKPRPNHLSAEDFVANVGQAFSSDFAIDPQRVTVAVFRLISQHVSEGEIKDVQACLPEKFQTLWS